MEIIEYLMIGTNVIVCLVILFGKSYVEAKAKNQAKKEDTEQITRLQEAVRVVFQKELATFQFENQHKLNMAVEQRNAIFDYTESMYVLRSAGEWSAIPKKDYFKTLRALNYQYQLKQARMKLLFDNIDFEALDNRFRAIVEQLHTFNAMYFSEVQVIINIIEDEQKKQFNGWQERIAKHKQNIDETHRKYSSEHWQKRQAVDTEIRNLQSLLRKMLNSLFEQQPG